MLFVIDSCGWIEYFTRGPLLEQFKKYILKNNKIITPSVIIFEVYKALKLKRNEEEATEFVSVIVNRSTIINLTKETVINAADLSLEYKLSLADALIYATAKEYKAKLVTSDPHLKNLENVVYIK